ncbi:protoporphyrinogen/coproporphyrinogen oxidase [Mucilaginibacter sp. FT3.2]|uniref:protoporphyrinogen/coproporphyrinogen oxidase n=1 Tax=Mucilaginibacter sp. FT3.2 TaxID=2723090 RepID=UPI001613BA0C|nr:NAD(P)-binding protein [Mucilaginibacter sp. FT3.2]MBB6230158.1 protoporphyrinogen oxidase [Mucilaginibacter sp. FT3.2]
MKIGVIGSGISGLSIANLLKENHDVVVFEKQKKLGGLIKCERVNDCLFHKVGGHVFNSKNKIVFNWFWSHFDKDKEFVQAKRNAKVFFNNNIIGYPIENYIYLFNKELIKDIVSELLELQTKPKISPFDYDNFEDFLKGNFGNTLYQVYFKPYNHKIWRTDLNTVSMKWLDGKLPMPNIEEIIQNNITRAEEDNMVHSTFYYPKEGGSQFIVDRLTAGLTILNDLDISTIDKVDEKLVIEGREFDKLIFCGDIRKIPAYCKQILVESGVDVNYLENLRSNGTSNLFCETDENDISWMYIPEDFTKAHRIIYTGNFSDTNNRGSSKKTCVVEFSGKVEYDVMVNEIKKLPGNLSPLSYNYEPNSYVIQDHRTRTEISAAKRALKAKGIFLLGRFAEWEYYNMDKAMEAAFDLYENELS